jgi:hypothetical protein
MQQQQGQARETPASLRLRARLARERALKFAPGSQDYIRLMKAAEKRERKAMKRENGNRLPVADYRMSCPDCAAGIKHMRTPLC